MQSKRKFTSIAAGTDKVKVAAAVSQMLSEVAERLGMSKAAANAHIIAHYHGALLGTEEKTVHTAFWTLEAKPGEQPNDFVKRVITDGCGASNYRDWANTETVVEEGYGSPYRFGRLLRELVGEIAAPVFRYTPQNIYFAMSSPAGLAAFYDPSKRTRAEMGFGPAEVDWFEAVDNLQEEKES